MSLFSLLSLIFSLLILTPLSSSFTPDRYIKSIPPSLRQTTTQEHFELTQPLPSDDLTPSCSLLVLDGEFGNTVGLPPVPVLYSPPSDCPAPWSNVVVEISATCHGDQYDRIAGVWLDGAEILRTSTAEPTDEGVSWKVRKDVTRYTSLFKQSNLTFSVMLENVVDDVYTGVYYVNVSLLYYSRSNQTEDRVPLSEIPVNRKLMSVDDDGENDELEFESDKSEHHFGSHRLKSQSSYFDLYETPADLIIPISDIGDQGFWFRIQSELDVHRKGIRIPLSTYKAALEVYISFHGDDEFWYTNPPDNYIRMNNLTTLRGNGAYRELFVTIDGSYIGSVTPFPVIFTGGINPLLWEPVVAIGAFNLPTYDFDLTPFLGLLLDDKVHKFGLGVSDSIPFWLVDANLHLWLDQNASVEAQPIDFYTPGIQLKRGAKFLQLDGSFKIGAKRKSVFSGWVKSSAGNITTHIAHQLKFKNQISYQNNGTTKMLKQKVQTKIEMMILSETGAMLSRTIVKRRYPLNVVTSIVPGNLTDTYMMITNVTHNMEVKLNKGSYWSSDNNSQKSGGWMVVKDHDVLSGGSYTNQTLTHEDESGCVERIVEAVNGELVTDKPTSTCADSS